MSSKSLRIAPFLLALATGACPAQEQSAYTLTNTSSTSARIAKFRESDLSQTWIRTMPNVQSTIAREFTVADGFVYTLTNTSSTSARIAKFRESDLSQVWIRTMPNVQSTIAREFTVADGFVYTLTNTSSTSARIAKFRESDLSQVWIRTMPNVQSTIARELTVANGFVYTLTNTSSTSARIAKFNESDLSQAWIRTMPNVQSTIAREFTVADGFVYTLTNTSSTSARIAKFRESDLSQVWIRTMPNVQSTIARGFTVSREAVAASITNYGAGCGPNLSGTPGTRPLVGQAIDLTVSNLPASTTFAIIAAGSSRQTYQSMSLPLSLGHYGLPNCYLHNSADLLWGVGYAGTSTQFALALPPSSVFAGVTFHFQAAAGNATSNGITVVIGNN